MTKKSNEWTIACAITVYKLYIYTYMLYIHVRVYVYTLSNYACVYVYAYTRCKKIFYKISRIN